MHRKLTLLSLAFVLALFPGCAATKKTMTNAGMTKPALTNELTKDLGVTASQAAGGVGALLQAAAEKLNSQDMQMITKAVPGASNYLETAQKALGGAKITDLGGVQGAFKKLGLTPEMVDQFKPKVLDYVGTYSPQARTMLASVI